MDNWTNDKKIHVLGISNTPNKDTEVSTHIMGIKKAKAILKDCKEHSKNHD